MSCACRLIEAINHKSAYASVARTVTERRVNLCTEVLPDREAECSLIPTTVASWDDWTITTSCQINDTGLRPPPRPAPAVICSKHYGDSNALPSFRIAVFCACIRPNYADTTLVREV